MKIPRSCCCLLLLLATIPLQATVDPNPARGAGSIAAEKLKESWTFSFYFENDLFSGTDSNYTNGVKVSWISPDLTDYRDAEVLPDWAYEATGYLPFIHEPGLQRNVALSIGQNMYTPQDIATRRLQSSDRPYAAWLYGALALHNKNEQWLDTMEISLGVVGPAALGEQTQNFVHEARGIQQANGWQHQLNNEPALNLVWERKYRLFKLGDAHGWGMDSVAHVGAALGNVYTYSNLGASLRLGWNVPYDFGSAPIRLAGDSNAPSSSLDPRLARERVFGFHVFGGVEGRGVLRDMFLDGNLFSDSHSVDRVPFVGDLVYGASLLYGHWKMSFAHLIRSKEFESQPRPRHAFGSLTISFSY